MIDEGTSFEAAKHKHLLQCLDAADFQMKPTPPSTGKTHDVPTDHALYQIIDQNWHFLSFAKAQGQQILNARPRWAGNWRGRHLRLGDLRPQRSSDGLDVFIFKSKAAGIPRDCKHFEQCLPNRRCMKMC